MSWLVVLTALTLVAVSAGCKMRVDPPVVESVERTVSFSDVVAAVHVTRRLSDVTEPLYVVEAEVFCVYKAPEDFSVNRTITIHNVGFLGGMCFGTNLTVGMEYIVFMYYDKRRHQFMPKDTQKSFTQDNVRYLASVCDTKLTIPEGTPSEESSRCPAPTGGSTCRSYEEDSPPGGGARQMALHVLLGLITILVTVIRLDCFTISV